MSVLFQLHKRFLIFPLFLFCIVAIAASSCSKNNMDSAKIDLHLISVSPSEVVLDNQESVQFKFDKPVVSEKKVGVLLTDVPVSFKPAIELEARWIDRYTLVVKPIQPYISSTRYEIELEEPLLSRLPDKERTHSFVHDPVRFSGIVGMDTSMAPSDPRFSLRFTQKVSSSAVVDACAVYKDNSNEKIQLNATSKNMVDTVIPLKLTKALDQGMKYQIRCNELSATKGNWSLKESAVSFTTYSSFKIVKALPKEKVIPPEAQKVKIQFATPVSREDFETYVRVLLNGNKVSNSHWSRSGNGLVYSWDSFLEAVSDYEIWIKKGLPDAFSQTLAKTKVIKFETTDAPPSISTETGISTIESQMGGFQVWTRNVSDLEIECAKIPTSRIAKVLTKGKVELYPWMGSEDADIKWKQLKLSPRKEKLQIGETKNKWVANQIALQDVCGNGKSSGFYLAQFSSDQVKKEKEEQGWGRYPYRVLGNITDLAVVLKAGPESGTAWVTSMTSGDVVRGATVTLYNVDGKKLHSGTTNSDGLVSLPGSAELNKKKVQDPNEYYDYYSVQRFVAVVEKAGDVAVVDGNWNSGITMWNFDVTSDRKASPKRIRGFIQSDRGIYKPGETVFFKSLIREVYLNAAPAVPRGRAHVMIDDPAGVTLFDKKIALSEFGSVDFKIKLSSEARLGDYYARVSVEDHTFRERFSVEEFRPVSFEIKKDFKNKDKLHGQELRFAFDADYLFGAPVKDAHVDWNVQRRRRHLSFPKYKRYSFAKNDSSYWNWYYDDMYGHGSGSGTEYVSEGTTRTDDNGRFSFSLRDSDKNVKYPMDYIGRATVIDDSDQTVTKTVVVKSHPTDVYLGIKSKSWIQKVKKPIELETVAVDKNGTSIKRDAQLVLQRESWNCGYHPGQRYYCDRETKTVYTKTVAIEKGGSSFSLPTKKPGDYIVTLRGKDHRGKKIESSTSVWVTGRGYFFWGGEDSHKMTLIPSKDKYAPGDVARVIPKGDTEGSTLLVTVERSGIVDSFILPGKVSGEAVEIPIKESYAPNVYVSVSAVTPRTGKKDSERPAFSMGIVNLKVSTRKKELKVAIETEKSEYEPGETVRGKIRVTANGLPVMSEVSISVADEGVLQLINYKTPNPIDSIYAPFGLGIDTSTNLLMLARFRNPIDDSEEGNDGGEQAGPKVRSKFVSSAYWKPDLVTGKNGEASFAFTAPDNLTAFRVMAVAADKRDKFGSSDERIVINKKLLLNPVLPRFFGSDDRVNIGAVIHNYSKSSGDVKLKWKLDGLWSKEHGQTVTVKNGESKRLFFNVKVGKRKEASVQISATMGEFSDAFRVTLPVRRNVSTSQQLVYEGKTSDTGEVKIDWPDDIVAKYSSIGISVDRFGLGMLGESLRYLVQYPYGCLEQTLSSLIPMFKVKDLATSMKLDELKGPKLKQFISFGVDKVFKHQHDDGHFSLWPGSKAYPHLTAYALWGLSEAKKAGIKVDAHAVDKGVAALERWTRKTKSPSSAGEASELAMAAFVLAYYGKADSGLNARLYEGRNLLPVYGKAHLLQAMILESAHRSLLKRLAREILAAATTQGKAKFVKEPNISIREQLAHYMSSDVRTTAMVISALIEYDSSLPIIAQLVDGLKEKRGSNGRWGNTQENIYSLIAVSDFVRANDEGEATVTIYHNGTIWQNVTLSGSKIVRFTKSLQALKRGTLRVQSDGPVYAHINMGLAKESANNRGVDKGFTVTREYVDAETGKAVEKVKVGSIVKVKLTISSRSARDYVAVSDPLPTGCEAINTRLATENSSFSDRTRTSYNWDYTELRDDRVWAFADRMQSGELIIEYLMRATIPGTFSVPGTLAEEMYAPAHFGLSDERTFKVYK